MLTALFIKCKLPEDNALLARIDALQTKLYQRDEVTTIGHYMTLLILCRAR